jgi:hypothetical protein
MRNPFWVNYNLVFGTLSPFLIRVNDQDLTRWPNQEHASHIGMDWQRAQAARENDELRIQLATGWILQVLGKHLSNLPLEG